MFHTYFTPFSSVFVLNFEQVNVSWGEWYFCKKNFQQKAVNYYRKKALS